MGSEMCIRDSTKTGCLAIVEVNTTSIDTLNTFVQLSDRYVNRLVPYNLSLMSILSHVRIPFPETRMQSAKLLINQLPRPAKTNNETIIGYTCIS